MSAITNRPLYLNKLHCTKTPKPLQASKTHKKASIVQFPTPTVPAHRKWRIALYSHDTMGLGHKRRNLLIAQTLGASALPVDILMISGMRDASHFSTPPGIDCLTLPALAKNADGQYQSRSLDLSLQEITHLRSQVIHTAIATFKPDIFIVDNVPRGAIGELEPTLNTLRHQPTRCILGLRDILDDPTTIERDWKKANNEEAIRQYYHSVWIYGDSRVYNLGKEYNFAPDIVEKLHYIGYLDQRRRLDFANTTPSPLLSSLNSKRLALCLVGGGQDGGELALAFAQTELPPNTQGIILTGPFMPEAVRQQLQNYSNKRTDLKILDYIAEPTPLVKRADWVIAMGGYNTTCEMLSFQKRALIVPRIKPRQEQLLRAERLHQLGLLDVLHPERVNPQALATWLNQNKPKTKTHHTIDLNGLQRIPQILAETLTKTGTRQ